MSSALKYEIEIKFLRKGDRVRLVNNASGKERYAICTMDGHAVSDEYGWLAVPSNKAYREYPENDYINVLFEDSKYAPEGSSERMMHPNETVRQIDVTAYTTAARAGQARNWLTAYNNGTVAQTTAESKIKEARRIIAEQEAVIIAQEDVIAQAVAARHRSKESDVLSMITVI